MVALLVSQEGSFVINCGRHVAEVRSIVKDAKDTACQPDRSFHQAVSLYIALSNLALTNESICDGSMWSCSKERMTLVNTL
ncbi:hypothetical protein RRG08_048058 [Elysia crispata]|uniref:Uncharacterized protein n=1 Tax=Elysia crispata TaxID=231223 RepID=A0AAE0Z2K2_9GAST|nr:hypothetical protein RRG08_048058 [Elysia crispata]